tara:strand:- start:2042 stop:3430 length:1389 start_codon:yes stop_codon:yes gene_type:complete
LVKKSEKIVADFISLVEKGHIEPGEKLPTHRDLAFDYECSVGTASRAYAELERRGYCYGRVGQGTFVYGTPGDDAAVGRGAFFPEESWKEGASDLTDLSKNSYFHIETEDRLRDAAQRLLRRNEPDAYFSYSDSRGRPFDREVAASWLSTLINYVETDSIILTQGAQSGLYLSMATLANAGETVATEAFGYPGIRAAAYELDLRIAPIAMDAQGMIPAAFEETCRRGKVSLLITVPTNHNPTGATQPLERREEIIGIARRHGVLIVEDSAYAPLHNRRIPAYYDLAPDTTVYLTTFSKVMSPALRLGYMIAPENLVPRLATKMTTINWMTSPIILDIANFLVQSGQVAAQARLLTEVCLRRERSAREILGPWLETPPTPDDSPLAHLWLRLPEGQGMSDFVSSARRENIIVVAGDTFAMHKSVAANHIRLCLMAEPHEGRVLRALERLATLLSQENSPIMVT